MTRRAYRTRYAILGALHEHGPQLEGELCATLRFGAGSLYYELVSLEQEILVIGEWVENNENRPRQRRYRITTEEERNQGKRTRRKVDREIAELVAARTPRRRMPLLGWNRAAT